MNKKYSDILLNPWLIFVGIGLGIVIGRSNQAFAISVAPFADIYLALLEMCILPIMITAIVGGLGNLLLNGIADVQIKRFIIVFIGGIFLASALGVVVGVIAKPGGALDSEAKTTLSGGISRIERISPTNYASQVNTPHNVAQFIKQIIPRNVFHSIDQGEMLTVIFFCILLGVALGSLRSDYAKTTLGMTNSLFQAFLKIVSWIMYGLPIALCFLFAGYASQLNFEEVSAMFPLILLIHLTALLMLFIYSLIIWRSIGGSYISSIKALQTPLFVAFGTSSSFAALPSMLVSLEYKLNLNKDFVDLIIPLGINLNRQGSIVRLILITLFLIHLYGLPLDFSHLFIIFFTAILSSIASSSLPGIASVGMFSIILNPLGLPVDVGVIFLIMITPLIDPLVTVVNIYGNCATAVLISKRTVKIANDQLTN